ncbi:MAG TPA: class I SAM-dependent methyltransferase [Microvirga sp.]|nr:class I SAM-dependent methyltransferase [Microvirga sp.]
MQLGQRLFRCGCCGFIYLAPDFDDTSVARFYECEYRRLFTTEARRPDDMTFFRQQRMQEIGDERARTLAPLIPPGGRVFELGSGYGGFLQALHRLRPDVSLFASEPDVKNRLALLDGVPVTFLDDLSSGPVGEFDLVVLFHVLEHLKNPCEVLSDIRRRLAPSGRLIIEVPDVLAPWSGWQDIHPAHLSYFSAATLDRLLRMAGFVPEAVGPHPSPELLRGTLCGSARLPRVGESIFRPRAPNAAEIAVLDAHLSRYAWQMRDRLKRRLKQAMVRMFGAERVGEWQRRLRRRRQARCSAAGCP